MLDKFNFRVELRGNLIVGNMNTLDKDIMKTPDKDIFQNQTSKHKALQSLSDQYNIPFVEYDDRLLASGSVLQKVNLEQLREELWFPLAIREGTATVIVSKPPDPALDAAMRKILGVDSLKLLIALPDDIIAIIENHQDINSGFPASSSRTTLARLRNWFAEYRVMLAKHRTILAKGRTGLAFMRTGISFHLRQPVAVQAVRHRISDNSGNSASWLRRRDGYRWIHLVSSRTQNRQKNHFGHDHGIHFRLHNP